MAAAANLIVNVRLIPLRRQPPHLSDPLEVVIIVKQRSVMLERQLCDKAIDRASYGYPLPTAVEKDARRATMSRPRDRPELVIAGYRY